MAAALSCSSPWLKGAIYDRSLVCLSSQRNVKCSARRSVRSIVVRNAVNSSTKVAEQIKPAATTSSPNSETVNYRATVVIKKQPPGKPWEIFRQGDPRPSSIELQLVSTNLDGTGRVIVSEVFSLETSSTAGKDTLEYVGTVIVNGQFDKPGAVLVTNKHPVEFFLETIDLESFQAESVSFCCYSWVHSPSVESTDERPPNRVFFYNEAFLPSLTPPGLKELREAELKSLRGKGEGTRKKWERVYDYDVYNDLGDPDKGKHLARPVAGGDAVPYPRRCRTGRPPMKSDASAESRLSVLDKNYVPRDEDFEQIKAQAFSSGRLRAILQRLVPAILTHFTETPDEFDTFTDIDRLFFEGVELRGEDLSGPAVRAVKRFFNIGSSLDNALKYPVPLLLEKDKFGWTRDTEFGRQMLAGLNPLMVRRLQEFPPTSTLSEKTYGPLKSALEKEEIEKHLDGIPLEQAMDSGKLFILDYHDVFLPLVNQINFLEGRKTYATRTIFFLDSCNVFRPVAIELTLPASKARPNGQRRTFYPDKDASGFWFWQAAKAHVSSNHSSYHQVVSHWLQTHAVIEPYVIAVNRQLSAMHPVAKLLDPHLRYTMQVNATARQTLISAQGVIEKCFTAGEHSMALSSAGYKTWRFDKQALPADLLDRGMAVEDEQSPHGLKLVFEDYPYAADGLLIWSALKKWVNEYLTIYYEDTDAVSCDSELQAWWDEIKHKGHPDIKQGWSQLTTIDDLTEILTSIIWVASAHHAAVNFGQFLFSGYIPNMPCMSRELVPEEGDANYELFMSHPQQFMLRLLPNQVQATTVMAVLQLLSTHHEDEEYLGERTQKNWTANQQVLEAAERFKAELKGIQDTLGRRNADKSLKHRHGAGIPPYELLMPHSGPGVTARGIPNSVTIMSFFNLNIVHSAPRER